MITFLTIFFVLIGLNAVMLLFSLGHAHRKAKDAPKGNMIVSPKTYRIDLSAADYKKAV